MKRFIYASTGGAVYEEFRYLPVDEKPIFDEKRPGEIERIYIDNTKALKELDWSLKVEFQEGIRLTTEFYEERRRQLS